MPRRWSRCGGCRAWATKWSWCRRSPAEELTLPSHGAVEFVDAETNRTLVVQPELAQAAYRERVRTWLAGFEAAVRREGLDYLRLSTADVLERELRRFLSVRAGAAR